MQRHSFALLTFVGLLAISLLTLASTTSATATGTSWSTPNTLPAPLPPQGARQHLMAIATSNGHIVSAWVQDDTYGHSVLQASISDDDGLTWSDPENVSEITSSWPFDVELNDISVSDSGVFLLLWRMAVPTSSGITNVVQASSNDGGETEGWTTPVDLSNRNTESADLAQAAVLTSNGTEYFAAVWGADSGTSQSLQSLEGTVTQGEIDWSSSGPTVVTDPPPGPSFISDVSDPSIEAANGTFLVAWSQVVDSSGTLSKSIINGAVSSDLGATWDVNEISDPNDDTQWPSVAVSTTMNASGVPLAVSWYNVDQQSTQVATKDGNSWALPSTLSSQNLHAKEFTRLFVDSNGSFIAYWSETNSAGDSQFFFGSPGNLTANNWQTRFSYAITDCDSAYLDDLALSDSGITAHDLLVAWECEDANGDVAVHTAVVDSTSWASSPVLSEIAGVGNYYTHVAALQSGGFITQWTQNESVIQVSTSSTGSSWVPEISLSTLNQGAISSLEIAVSPQGDFTAVWIEQNMFNIPQVRVATSTDGTTWAAGPVLSTPGTWASNVEVAVDSVGNVVAVWKEADPTTGDESLQSVQRIAGATNWSSPIGISSSGQNPQTFTLAVNDSGLFTIAWIDSSVGDVFASISLDHGSSWQSSALDPATNSGNETPSVAITTSDNFVFGWTSRDTNVDQYITVLAATGGATTQALSNPSTDGDCWDVALANAGSTLVAAWVCDDPASTDNVIQTATSTDGGLTWTRSPNSVFSGVATNAVHLIGTPTGRVVMTWVFADSNSSNWIAATSTSEDSGQTWQPETPLSGLAHEARPPVLTSNSTGEFAAVWLEAQNDGIYQTRASTLAPTNTIWANPSTVLNTLGDSSWPTLTAFEASGEVGFIAGWLTNQENLRSAAQTSVLLTTSPTPTPPTPNPIDPTAQPSHDSSGALASTGISAIVGLWVIAALAALIIGGLIIAIRVLLSQRTSRRH